MILNIPFSDIVFYFVAVFMVLLSIAAVTSKNVLRSAIFLIATFLGTAILYLLLKAEFMAMAQIMLYVGGVVVFIIFAILLTSHLGENKLSSPISQKFLAVFLALTLLGVMAKFLFNTKELSESIAQKSPEASSLIAYGERLLSYAPNGFVLPFEIISILLFMTLVVAITIAKKDNKEEK